MAIPELNRALLWLVGALSEAGALNNTWPKGAPPVVSYPGEPGLWVEHANGTRSPWTLPPNWTRANKVWATEDRDKLRLLVESVQGETVDKLRLHLVELHEQDNDFSGAHACIFGSVLDGINYLSQSYQHQIVYHQAQDGLLEQAQKTAEKLGSQLAEVERPLDEQMARLNEALIKMSDRAFDAERKLERLTTSSRVPELLDDRPSLARAVHYPQRWDTATYPTLDHALQEVCAGFECQEGATAIDKMVAHAGNLLARECYRHSKEAGWWVGPGGADLHDDPLMFPAQLMLCVTELAEACEGDRTGVMDNHLPQYPMKMVEIADAVSRACMVAGAYGWPLGDIIVAKTEYNKTRADHTLQARSSQGGKKY